MLKGSYSRFGLPEKRMRLTSPGHRATVAGAGYVALDLVLSDVRGQRLRRRAGGTCGNVLAILSFLGFNSVPIARLGSDEAADVLISDLRSVGVDCTYIQRDSRARTAKVVEFIPNRPGAAHRFAFKCPICQRRLPKRSEPIYEQAIESLRDIDPQLFFFDRIGSSTIRLASEARSGSALVMFEPASFKQSAAFDMALRLSDIVKYSRRRIGQSIDPWLDEKHDRPRLVVETLDGGGLRYKTRVAGQAETTWKHQKAFIAARVIDQAGAGDWCSAGLIARILTRGATNRWSERTISRALALGQALAAASIGFKGPRGYLENTSQRLVCRAALSTLRQGRVPDWIAQDQDLQAWAFTKDGQGQACALCLAPVCDIGLPEICAAPAY